MNPESRIKLLLSLEEIRNFQIKNYDLPKWKRQLLISLGLYLIFFGKFFYDHSEFRYLLILILFLPLPLISIWLLLKYKFDEKYKLLASAILELGSIAQENPIPEPRPQKIETKVTRTKKQISKRKKK